MAQMVQKFFVKAALGAEKRNVLLIKGQFFDIIDDLFQAGGNGKAASIGDRAEKNVKIADLSGHIRLKVAVCHGKFIKVAKHGVVEPLFFHG